MDSAACQTAEPVATPRGSSHKPMSFRKLTNRGFARAVADIADTNNPLKVWKRDEITANDDNSRLTNFHKIADFTHTADNCRQVVLGPAKRLQLEAEVLSEKLSHCAAQTLTLHKDQSWPEHRIKCGFEPTLAVFNAVTKDDDRFGFKLLDVACSRTFLSALYRFCGGERRLYRFNIQVTKSGLVVIEESELGDACRRFATYQTSLIKTLTSVGGRRQGLLDVTNKASPALDKAMSNLAFPKTTRPIVGLPLMGAAPLYQKSWRKGENAANKTNYEDDMDKEEYQRQLCTFEFGGQRLLVKTHVPLAIGGKIDGVSRSGPVQKPKEADQQPDAVVSSILRSVPGALTIDRFLESNGPNIVERTTNFTIRGDVENLPPPGDVVEIFTRHTNGYKSDVAELKWPNLYFCGATKLFAGLHCKGVLQQVKEMEFSREQLEKDASKAAVLGKTAGLLKDIVEFVKQRKRGHFALIWVSVHGQDEKAESDSPVNADSLLLYPVPSVSLLSDQFCTKYRC